MKYLTKIFILLAILLFVPASSYALVDFGIYGGFAVGDWEAGSKSYDTAGGQYGFIGHFNGGVPLLISVGVGGFWQKSSLTVDFGGTDIDIDKITYGFDAYAMLELPIIIHPYIRGGIAIKDKIEEGSSSRDDKFNSIYYGLGVSLTVFPTIRLFGEYIMTQSTFGKDDNNAEEKVNLNAVNFGAMIMI